MFGPLHFKSSEPSSEPVSCVLICIVCDKQFDEYFDLEEYMNHLLEHNLIIKDYEGILDLKSYARYWNVKLKTSSLKEICGENSCENSTEDKKSSPYYVLSPVMKEDKELRSKLMKESLQRALDNQSHEREDKNFSRRCLFCNLVVEPTRYAFMNHLSTSHNLMIGKPDNLVYIDKLISLLEARMENLKCIYCEKVFKDRQVLKEHMRKKMHKRINPKNSIYDQFYMINYISPSNVHLKAKKKKICLPPTDSDNEEKEEDWSDWNEKNAESIVCIFCSDSFSNWEDTIKHLSGTHSFDFDSLVSSMSFYERVKLVNFIRNRIYKSQCPLCEKDFSSKEILLSHMAKEEHFKIPSKAAWDQPEFFFPTYENDTFLCYLEDSADEAQPVEESSSFPPMPFKPSRMLKSLNCLFCSHTISNAEVMLTHMSDVHNFHYYNFTLDHNFVSRVKLIQYLKQQLSKLTCLNCSFISASVSELMEHMDSNNHLYPPQKDVWDTETGNDSDGNETVDYLYALESIGSMEGGCEVESGQFSDYDDDAIPIVCLFCPDQLSSFKEALDHLIECHQFDFVERTKTLTFYDQVKLVTFTRERIKNGQCPYCEDKLSTDLLTHLKEHTGLPSKDLWDRTAYYPGSFEGDPFLSELNVHHATDMLKGEEGTEAKRMKSSAEEDEIEWCDWDEEMSISIVCLLCEHVAEGWQPVLSHMSSTHSFDYSSMTSGLPFYDQVKLVNFIRDRIKKQTCISCDVKESSSSDLLTHMASEKHLVLPSKLLWDKPQYFAPVLQNDGFLSQLDDNDDDDYL